LASYIGQEYRSGVSGRRALRRIFGTVMEEVMHGEVTYEDHRDFYSLPCVMKMMIVRRMSWVGHIACIGDPRNAYRILID
jgi:hypothetical protein